MYAEPLDRKPSMGERYRGQRIDPGAVSVRAAMNKSFGETVSRQKPRCGVAILAELTCRVGKSSPSEVGRAKEKVDCYPARPEEWEDIADRAWRRAPSGAVILSHVR